jgi:uncharacterized membrane protein YoaK (UPF0700 family)
LASLDGLVERFDTSERLFVAALSSLAGFVDAVGFLQSKGFFVSFMSGNSTRLGVGLAQSYPDALAAAGLVCTFILGVAAGTLLGRRSEGQRAFAVMTAVSGCLAAAAFCSTQDLLLASLSLIAFAMGAENAALERKERVRIGVTYMTGSVVKLGQALADAMSRKPGGDWSASLLLLAGFIGGATAGALAASWLGFAALWLGSAMAASLAILSRYLRGSGELTG